MNLFHIVSQYPSLTETFIARQLIRLTHSGASVTIGSLRQPDQRSCKLGVPVPGVELLYGTLNPLVLVWSLLQLGITRPGLLASAVHEVFLTVPDIRRFVHLTYCLATAAYWARKLQRHPPGHIRAHFLHSEAVTAYWLSQILHVPYSLTAHVISIRYPQRLVVSAVRAAAFVVCDTQQTYDLIAQLREQDVYLIKTGLDLEQFEFCPAPRPANNAPLVLAVGSLLDPKGFDVFLQACARLKQQGECFVCKIVGEGPERSVLENLGTQLQLTAILEMPGALPFDQLQVIYPQATLFVMPSKDSPQGSDGLPTVLIENLALGTPVVATRKAGIPDLIKHGETGLLAEPGDPQTLAACIARLLHDQALQQQFSHAGRALVEEQFDICKTVARIVELIELYTA